MVTVVKGKVSQLKLSTSHLNGTSNHAVSFMLDEQAVSLETQHLAIDEGDFMIVSGRMKHGLLQAHAYKNITKNVFVPFPHILAWFVTCVFCLVPIFMLLVHPLLALICLPAFPGLPLFMALRISSGNAAIRSHLSFQTV